MSRRGLLQGLGLGAGALALAACATREGGSTTGNAATQGPGGIDLARPDSPVKLPLYDDNQAIKSGLNPEAGPLKVYCWTGTVPKKTFASFEEKYGIEVRPTFYGSPDEALPKILSGSMDFDVYECSMEQLPILVANKVIQPVNSSYLPNYEANVWDHLQSPWYDADASYTTPGYYWSTGIAWREDHLPDFDPASFENPYDAFWQLDGIAGKVQFFDYMRDALAMTLLRNGVSDINTTEKAHLDAAVEALRELTERTRLRLSTDAYQTLAQGTNWIEQAWGADVYFAEFYLPKNISPEVLKFWAPEDGAMVTSDSWVISRNAKNPVAAHLWMDHLLEREQGVNTVQYSGVITPVRGMEMENVVADGIMDARLLTALPSPEQIANGVFHGPLSKEGETAWQNAWLAVKSYA
ncbi:extracellular solute-binding protein [Nocardioides glacieisoli]|uniref:Extracellular solute-binding protein n=1 Tax=Nocardioides glacieisoli TaxID=1168730 RepID=A0A4Q2RWK5_9ACTN|nr:extracellular solute-binding protein [Nocardioides glacieisoli]RYB92259.1 extracellular solute-binding protein [Nocardioides glacieisoli]